MAHHPSELHFLFRHPDGRRGPDFGQVRWLQVWVPSSRLGEAEASLRRRKVDGMTEIRNIPDREYCCPLIDFCENFYRSGNYYKHC
jgi:hypothetical protein